MLIRDSLSMMQGDRCVNVRNVKIVWMLRGVQTLIHCLQIFYDLEFAVTM